MCVIIELESGQLFPEKALENAVANNPHGVGIIYSQGDDMRVERYLPEKPNPEFVMRLLEKDKDSARFLHLRNRTRGPINKENLHPFSVITDKKNSVYMMHNGTFGGMGSSSDTESSDSKLFAEQIVKPILERIKFTNGYIDLNDPVVKLIFDGYVNSANKVVLINKGSSLKLGNWMDYSPAGTEEKYIVSNLQYFHSVVRGTVYGGASHDSHQTRFQQGHNSYNPRTAVTVVKKGEEETTKTAKTPIETKSVNKTALAEFTSNEKGVTSLSFIEALNKNSYPLTRQAVASILGNDTKKDVFDPIDFVQIGYLDVDELAAGIKESAPSQVATLLICMAAEIEEMINELDVQKGKRHRAELKIAELKSSLETTIGNS